MNYSVWGSNDNFDFWKFIHTFFIGKTISYLRNYWHYTQRSKKPGSVVERPSPVSATTPSSLTFSTLIPGMQLLIGVMEKFSLQKLNF